MQRRLTVLASANGKLRGTVTLKNNGLNHFLLWLSSFVDDVLPSQS